MERVDFYVIDGTDARERWRFACRVIDKAFNAEHRVLVWLENAADVQAFDDLLWTFAQDSFIPHEPLGPESDWEESPVLLSCERLPAATPDVIVNLAAGLPRGVAEVARIVEIIDADAARRQAGRARFKQYRELGIEPQTHNIGTTASE
jgi:DNA polymerase-3 subunit chi